VFAGTTPATLQTFNGGADVTRAIERELRVDERTAEKRKRILGTAGAGERARAALACDIAALLQSARGSRSITRVALVGNGARLPGLAADVETATGAACELPVSDALRGDAYPEDVVRSGAPDWTLATGLALWRRK
jgi:Tfp pilus assembly PilM family ATPase